MNLFFAGQEPNFGKMLLLSVMVHALLLALLSYSTGRAGRFLEGKVYTVDIVTIPVEKKGTGRKAGKRVEKVHKRSKPAKKKARKVSKPGKVIRKSKASRAKRPEVRVSRRKAARPATRARKRAAHPEAKAERPAVKRIAPARPVERSIISEIGKTFDTAIKGMRKESISEKVNPLLSRGREVEKAVKPLKRRSVPDRRPLQGVGVGVSPEKTISRLESAFARLEEGRTEEIRKTLEKEEDIRAPDLEIKDIEIEIGGKEGLPTEGTDLAGIADIIRGKIQKNWKVDKFVAMRRDYASLRSVVTIRVSRFGSILEIKPIRESANPSFQESVIKAIKASDPLPVRFKREVEITLTFYPGE